jgi:integrase
MASKRDGIQQRKNGDGTISFRAQVRLGGFPPQSETFRRRTDAKIWVEKTKTAIREGRHLVVNESKKHTLGALVDRHLESVERKSPHAYQKQRQILLWWKDQLGVRALSNLTPALIAEQRDALLAENIGTAKQPRHRSPATANRYLAALSKACTVAMREWHWLQDNPVARVQKERESPGRVRYLSPEEKDALLAACAKSPVPQLNLITMLALTTGMRRGEILGLRWPDIDLARGRIVLHKTKNNERRAVPIVPSVLVLLEKHAQVRHLHSDLVFARPDKSHAIDVDHSFQDAVRAAKVENFRFHDLRHTAASYLAMSGATTAEIAAVLGHKTLAMVKRYAHLSDQHTGAVVERMTRKFFG